MKKLYRIKHQYEERWLMSDYKKYNIHKAFYNDVQWAALYDDIENIYKLIDDENLEVRIETIYVGDNV